MRSPASAMAKIRPALGVLAFLALWQVWSLFNVKGGGSTVPAPSEAIGAIWRDRVALLSNALVSMTEAVAGLIIALAVSFVVAAGTSMSRRFSELIMPFVLAQQTIPLIIIAPMLAPVIGNGWTTTVVFDAWLCWFPAVIAWIHGFDRVPPERLAVLTVAGASRWQIFRYLRLPGAASSLVAGAQSCAGFALIGAIVLEYGGAKRGLGAMVIEHVRGIHPMAPDIVFGLILLCASLGIILTWVTRAIFRIGLAKWLVDEAL